MAVLQCIGNEAHHVVAAFKFTVVDNNQGNEKNSTDLGHKIGITWRRLSFQDCGYGVLVSGTANTKLVVTACNFTRAPSFNNFDTIAISTNNGSLKVSTSSFSHISFSIYCQNTAVEVFDSTIENHIFGIHLFSSTLYADSLVFRSGGVFGNDIDVCTHISLEHHSQGNIESMVVDDTAQACIGVELTHNSVMHLSDSTMRGLDTAVWLEPHTSAWISNCSFYAQGYTSIEFLGHSLIVSDCTFVNSYFQFVTVNTRSGTMHIRNSFFRATITAIEIVVTDHGNHTIENCSFAECETAGILLGGGGNVIVKQTALAVSKGECCCGWYSSSAVQCHVLIS